MATRTDHSGLDRIRRALDSRPPRLAERDEPFVQAAIALVLRPSESGDDLELLLIRRATRSGDPWSGQIGLPGGRFDSRDASLQATALRETHEEVGLDLSTHGAVLGALDELRPRTPVLPPIIVSPFVVGIDSRLPLTTNDEVADHRWVRLGALFAASTRIETVVTVRDTQMRVSAFQLGDFTVWGMTERILTAFEGVWR